MKTTVTVIVTLTVCCLLYQTTKAASIGRNGFTREQLKELLETYGDDFMRQDGDKRSITCHSFTACMTMRVAQDRVAALLQNQNAHLFGLNGPGKRRRSVDDVPQLNSAETE